MSKKKRSDNNVDGDKSKNGKIVKKDTSQTVHQRDKIKFRLNIRERNDLTEKQKNYLDIILDKKTKIVFLNGPAGVSKTYLALLAGLCLLDAGKVSDILYVRSIIESASKSLGALPGEVESKMMPFLMPLMDKMDEFLPKNEVDALIKDKRVVGMPINYLRGSSMNAKFIIGDEMQNMNTKEAVTLLTRLGEHSKLILCGDPGQSDLQSGSSFMKMFDLFNDEYSRGQGIHCLSFTREDIVRSGILKYIIERIEGSGALIHKSEPMFPAK